MSLRVLVAGTVLMTLSAASAQEYGQPDRDQPGDRMIQEYLAAKAVELDAKFAGDFKSREDWDRRLPEYRQQYLDMLGLWPLPEKTPLHATITGKLEGDGYIVDNLHYQSRPGLYVTANLYRPSKIAEGERLPAVLYVCGHSGRGRNGNKTAFQSHGMWFARHGYVCLIVDTLQLGEIAAIHHGTYREQRWWWHSRGYTPAGVECWNGVRGIDYLISRADVDPERIAVTGISGGGAATFWVTAAEERVKVAVPISGMADLESYVGHRVINGHCDCMFLYNTYQWPWTRIAALVAPRPMLFTNSDQDAIFPMDANQRISNGLERLYSLYGAGDRVDALVSIGGHAYRQDIRQGTFRFINSWLKDDPRVVTDTEVDLVADRASPSEHPINPERLRAFPTDSDIPRDQLNTTIDEHFVPLGQPSAPADGKFAEWKDQLLKRLRERPFRSLPERIPAAKHLRDVDERTVRLETEPGIEVQLRLVTRPDNAKRVLLVIAEEKDGDEVPSWTETASDTDAVVVCHVRGTGPTRWTRRNPPNYVERSHALLGMTVDTGRVRDIAAVARYIEQHPQASKNNLPIHAAGRGPAGLLAAYAAIWEPAITGVTLLDPPVSHMDNTAPQFLSLLRIADVPDLLGVLAPKALEIQTEGKDALARTAACYRAAGAAEKLRVRGR